LELHKDLFLSREVHTIYHDLSYDIQ
jgi:hypothetical protein